MKDHVATDLHIFPRPRHVRRLRGYYLLPKEGILDVEIEALDRDCPQGYQLSIRPDGITIRASEDAGLQHGLTTLSQLATGACPRIAAMEIEDWPDFPVRGVMLDISRDKVPKMRELLRLVDHLAGWKINQLQLYMEHTFAYEGHARVWRGASPMTAVQIRRLDRYCAARGIELVPNQNSFGHMERWLRHAPYRRLAETNQPWQSPWGTIRDEPTTLCPLDRGSIRLVSELYRQLLPNFSSRLLNVGCDETFELGQGRSRDACRRIGTGRVYLNYLKKVNREVRRRGRRMMFWADIILKYPKLIAQLPKDAIALIWGYERDHPFGAQCRRVAKSGLSFYVCPGTSSWCSFAGRTANALANLSKAARSGQRHGAQGFLITDWGDYGHRQYLPASYGPLLYGAGVAWCRKANERVDLAAAIDRHVFEGRADGLGGLWLEAGELYRSSGVPMTNRTVLFDVMQRPMADIRNIRGLKVGAIRQTLRSIDGLIQQTGALVRRRRRGQETRNDSADLALRELRATLAVLRHACRRAIAALSARDGEPTPRVRSALATEMRGILREHEVLWRARNRPGGLASSLRYYRQLLSEYASKDRRPASGSIRHRRA